MNKTEASRYIESVNGTIIGDYWSTGQLFYENRTQGPRFTGADDDSIIEQARAYAARLRAEYGAEYDRLYPLGLTLRIFND